MYGTTSISLGELEAWCQQNSVIPDDDDQPWVMKYEIKYEDDNYCSDDGNKFRFFVTTKRLLFNATMSNKIYADATCKFIWQYLAYCVYVYLTMLKNGEKQLVLVHHSLKIIYASISLTFPPEAKNVKIGTKRKRGRPSKARKAVLIQ